MNIVTATTRPLRLRHRHRQRGVVAIEFALMFMFGMLPLLMLTLAGVLIFAAKQSLTLAADNGARAALHYNAATGGNLTDACSTALQSMNWLFALSGNGTSPTCTSTGTPPGIAQITVSPPSSTCTNDTTGTCTQVTVTTTYDYNKSPLILGTGTLYGWLLSGPLQSTAVIQIYNN